MTSQTARRPRTQRPTGTAKTAKKYTKQTAHVEARRDGKPLVFGWGGHLSHNDKVTLQRRAVWAFTSLTALLIVAVLVGFWVNINVVVPGLAITTVNGQAIPQSDYRKLFALNAQFEANYIYGPHGLNAQRDSLSSKVAAQQKIIDDATKQITSLKSQISKLPAGTSTQRTDLQTQLTTEQTTQTNAQSQHDKLNADYQTANTTTVPNELQRFTQSQYGNDSVSALQDDVFIRQWLAKQSADVQAKVQPSSTAIDNAISDFTANLPTSSSYSKFLSANSLSSDDARAMMTLRLRSANMQSYLAAQITPPLYEVHALTMTLSTQKDANTILQLLKKGGKGNDFATLAKSKSVDTNTNTKGGDLGWLARGQYAQTIASNTSGIVDNWIFDPARKPNELSGVISENGAFHIVQIVQIDPAHQVEVTVLSSLQSNALTAWLLGQKGLLGLSVISSDQNKLLDPLNIPNTTPAIPSAAPAVATPTAAA